MFSYLLLLEPDVETMDSRTAEVVRKIDQCLEQLTNKDCFAKTKSTIPVKRNVPNLEIEARHRRVSDLIFYMRFCYLIAN